MTTHTGHTNAIPASRVIGTAVYNTAGASIGTIEDVMLEKSSNGIMFAVIGFGGFLGIGEKYHAFRGRRSTTRRAAAATSCRSPRTQLEAAPAYSINDLTGDDGHGRARRSYEYYKVAAVLVIGRRNAC